MDRLQSRLRHVREAALRRVHRMRAQRHTEHGVEPPSRPASTSAAAAVAATLGVTEAEYHTTVDGLWKPEVEDDSALGDGHAHEELRDVMGAVVKLTKPMVVVETGAAKGLTCAVILAALESNGEGQLYSMDLAAAQSRPEEVLGSAVPDNFRSRWTLEPGTSRQILPELVQHVAPIDVSLHDADHSHAGQLEEYRMVWPQLRSGGVMVSDDVRGPAFLEFTEEAGAQPKLIGGDEERAPVGIVRKA